MAREWTWWTPTRRPSFIIADWEGNVLAVGEELDEDEAYCDLCNGFIFIRPVPLYRSHALCPDCFRSLFGLTVEQAAEQDGIHLTEIETDF